MEGAKLHGTPDSLWADACFNAMPADFDSPSRAIWVVCCLPRGGIEAQLASLYSFLYAVMLAVDVHIKLTELTPWPQLAIGSKALRSQQVSLQKEGASLHPFCVRDKLCIYVTTDWSVVSSCFSCILILQDTVLMITCAY